MGTASSGIRKGIESNSRSIKGVVLLMAIVVAFVLAAAVLPAKAFAEEDDIASGTVDDGTSSYMWTVTAEGVLEISPADGSDSGTIAGFSSSLSAPWYDYRESIVAVVVDDGMQPASSLKYLFARLSYAEAVSLPESWDTASVTTFANVFYNCLSLETVDVSGWVTSSATTIGGMFSGCSALEYVDVSDWDTSSITSMASVFSGCSSIAAIDVSGWDTSSVTTLQYMFSECSSLVSLDVSGWDVTNVTSMYCTFYNCSSLTALELGGWEAPNLINIRNLFDGCSSIEVLDLSGFDTSAITTEFAHPSHSLMDGLFDNCTSLKEVTFGTSWVWVFMYDRSEIALPESDTETGMWVKSDGSQGPYSPTDLIKMWNSKLAGTWVWYTGTADDGSDIAFTRLSGDTRYATMQAIISAAWDGETSEYAVVATGASFPDALAAASLAGVLDAPIVLANPSDSSIAISVLESLGVSTVYVVGGENAVSSTVVESIEDIGATVTRVYGGNRYETALAIAEVVQELGSESTTAIVACGSKFPDALSASPYSYWSESPIYLASSDGSLSEDVISAIESGGYTDVIVVGGTGVVSEDAVEALESIDGLNVERIYGSTRYETSAKMAEWSVDEGMSYDGAAVATGKNFPDALAGGAFCGSLGSVILLADDGSTAAVDLLESAGNVSQIYILGGTGAVSTSLVEYLEGLF